MAKKDYMIVPVSSRNTNGEYLEAGHYSVVETHSGYNNKMKSRLLYFIVGMVTGAAILLIELFLLP